MEMSGEGLLKQKESYGKQCAIKKGKVRGPPTVQPWRGAVGNRTPMERRDHLDYLAPLGETLNIFEQENYTIKEGLDNKKQYDPPGKQGKSKAMSNGNRHLGTGKQKESKVRLSLQKDRE